MFDRASYSRLWSDTTAYSQSFHNHSSKINRIHIRRLWSLYADSQIQNVTQRSTSNLEYLTVCSMAVVFRNTYWVWEITSLWEHSVSFFSSSSCIIARVNMVRIIRWLKVFAKVTLKGLTTRLRVECRLETYHRYRVHPDHRTANTWCNRRLLSPNWFKILLNRFPYTRLTVVKRF